MHEPAKSTCPVDERQFQKGFGGLAVLPFCGWDSIYGCVNNRGSRVIPLCGSESCNQVHADSKCFSKCHRSAIRSVYLDFHFIAVGIADEGGKPLPPGAAVDFRLSRLQPFALERGDDVIN